MKRLIIVFILLLAVRAHAAIALRCTGTGPNPNGGNITQNLCGSTANNDYVLVAVVTSGKATSNAPPYATPSGWTSLCNIGIGAVFGKKWLTGDPTSVTMVPQNGASSWETSVTITYSGVNTTTPVNGTFANCTMTESNVAGGGDLSTYQRAPSVSPTWTTDQLVGFYIDASAGGVTFTLPGALISQINQAPGPTIRVGDAALSSAAITGNLDATCSCHNEHFGAQVLLLPASGGASASTAVQPTFGGITGSTSNGSIDWAPIFPQDGDLLMVANLGNNNTNNAGISTGGWTCNLQFHNTLNISVCTKPWHTGDATTATLSNSATNPFNFLILIRNWQYAANSLVPSYDTGNTASEVASGTSINAPSISLASTAELALGLFVGNALTTWTKPASMLLDESGSVNANAHTAIEASLQGPSNPTGTFTGTSSATTTLDAATVAFKIAAAAAANVRHKSVQN